jgi:hypothetical protein
MNQRIQELLKQSTYEILGVKQVDQKQFAESIVKDCCDVLIKWKHEPFPFDESVAVSLIREHFGVER